MGLFAEVHVILHLNEYRRHRPAGKYVSRIADRYHKIDPTLVIGAKNHGTTCDESPEVPNIDQIRVSNLKHVIKPYTGVLEGICKRFLLLSITRKRRQSRIDARRGAE